MPIANPISFHSLRGKYTLKHRDYFNLLTGIRPAELICPGDNFHFKSPSFYNISIHLIPTNMKLSLALVTVLATFAVALPQSKAGQGNQAQAQKQQGQAKGGQAAAKAQGNNGAAAAGAAAAADGVNAKANNGADVSLASLFMPLF